MKVHLVHMYPADPPFSFDHDFVGANDPFLGVIVLSLWPLRITVFLETDAHMHLHCMRC